MVPQRPDSPIEAHSGTASPESPSSFDDLLKQVARTPDETDGGANVAPGVATFESVVPTGLETTAGHVFVTQMGPIPHHPEDGKVVALRAGREPREVASGASMLIDVERGPRGRLYGISQGQWDGVGEDSRAEPDTGRLVVVGRHGDLTPVVDGRGKELVLDRPVSVEFVGTTAYVLSVTGVVYRVDDL